MSTGLPARGPIQPPLQESECPSQVLFCLGGQAFVQEPAMAADGEQGGPGRSAVELRAQGQDGFRGEGVRRERPAGRGADLPELIGVSSAPGRVDEDDPVEAGSDQGIFDIQLKTGFGPEPLPGPEARPPFQTGDQGRAKSVVTPAGISVAADEDSLPAAAGAGLHRVRRSMTFPRVSHRDTSRGIVPKACVAQLRHGS